MTGIDFLGLVVGVALGYTLGHVLVFFMVPSVLSKI